MAKQAAGQNLKLMEATGYLKDSGLKVDLLNQRCEENLRYIDSVDTTIKTKKKNIQDDFQSLKDDSSAIKEEVREMQKNMLSMIAYLKSSLKSEEYNRFKNRLEYWNPENLITRAEAEKILKRENIIK